MKDLSNFANIGVNSIITDSQFLAVLLEDEANEYMKEHGIQKYNNVCTQMSTFNKLAIENQRTFVKCLIFFN